MNNNDIHFILPEPNDKPIKVVYRDDWEVEGDGNEVIFSKRLSEIESKNLLVELFGTTDIGVLDCSDMPDEEFDKIIDEFNSIGCTSFRMTADEIKQITKKAEWWHNEDGGYFCSNCGLFFDDYYEPVPDQCEKCGFLMNKNNKTTVWRDYHLSLDGVKYAYETEYPEWLLELRSKYKNNRQQEK